MLFCIIYPTIQHVLFFFLSKTKHSFLFCTEMSKKRDAAGITVTVVINDSVAWIVSRVTILRRLKIYHGFEGWPLVPWIRPCMGRTLLHCRCVTVYGGLPGSYQVRPHLIPMTEQMWPIQRSRSGSYSVMVVESMTCCGRRFHLSVTRSEKKWRLRSSRHMFFIILAVCPLVTVLLLNVNMLLKLVVDHPLYIVNTSSRSARFLLSSNDHKLRNSSRFAYV